MCAIAQENGLKGENDEFLVITLKHVPGHIPMRIPLERQNCGQYVMKMAIKHENKKVFVHTLKHVSGLKVILNRAGTPKLWAITHENNHQMQNQRVFGYNRQTCPWNPKNVRNSS